jgi:hypothetical protein
MRWRWRETGSLLSIAQARELDGDDRAAAGNFEPTLNRSQDGAAVVRRRHGR